MSNIHEGASFLGVMCESCVHPFLKIPLDIDVAYLAEASGHAFEVNLLCYLILPH